MRIALMCALLSAPAFCADVYFNDFNAAPGTTYPEWTSSGYSNSANRAGTVAAGAGPQTVATVASPNGRQRFLGEFGGPVIVGAPPYDAQHFVTVEETITLTLRDLKPHTLVTVAFDLYILKSWDGNNRTYGPDRWRLRVQDGPTLLDTTFSNNPKTGADLSQQNYPATNSPQQSGAVAVNTLGYTFYGDSIYHLSFNFPHTADTLALNFWSSLFEGKGTQDESWGLDNVRVSSNSDAPIATSAAAPSDARDGSISTALFQQFGCAHRYVGRCSVGRPRGAGVRVDLRARTRGDAHGRIGPALACYSRQGMINGRCVKS
jgi:hypothetical protein